MTSDIGVLRQDDVADKISQLLIEYEFSLFKLEEERADNFLKNDTPEECEYDDIKRNSRMEIVAARLMSKKLDGVEDLLQEEIEGDPENIHVWMNKSMYHVMKADAKKATEAYDEALRLHETTVPRLFAKIAYAYWIAERGRSDEMRKKCFELLEEVLIDLGKVEDEDSRWRIQKLCSFSYLKVLVRYFKSPYINNVSDGQKYAYLKRIFDMLTSMANEGTDFSEQRVWIWLAEILEYQSMNRLRRFGGHLQELSKHPMFPEGKSISYKGCVDMIEKLVEKGSVHFKTIARASKIALHYAYSQSGEERKRYLDKCLEFAERSLASKERIYMADEAAAKANIHLWAMEFLKENPAVVQSENKTLFGKPAMDEKQQLNGLCTRPFLLRDSNERTNFYLQRAVHHFQKLEESHSSSAYRTCLLARTMYSLGSYSDEEIEELLHEAITCFSCDRREIDVVDCETTLGRFYEKTGQLDKAREMYRRAIRNPELRCRSRIAQHRLQSIQNLD